MLLVIGLVDGVISFLARNILHSPNFLNFVGIVNFFVFGMAVSALISVIASAIVYNAGIIARLASGSISGVIFAVVFIIGGIILICTFIFTDISVSFRASTFLYWASPVLMIIAGIARLVQQSG